jgi:hypothetical protein
MNFDSGTAYAESDADDEYERDMHGSSPIATDVENSPIDSEPPSAEHTPTTYGYRSSADRLPETIISEWTAEECADFIASIGVQQYADRFIGKQAPGLSVGWTSTADAPCSKKMRLLARPLSPCNMKTSKQWE